MIITLIIHMDLTSMQKRHPNVFLSLSTAINSRSANHRALIAACAPSRLLVESDFCNVRFCTTRTWDMVRIVAEVKGWRIEQDWEEEDEAFVCVLHRSVD